LISAADPYTVTHRAFIMALAEPNSTECPRSTNGGGSPSRVA